MPNAQSKEDDIITRMGDMLVANHLKNGTVSPAQMQVMWWLAGFTGSQIAQYSNRAQAYAEAEYPRRLAALKGGQGY